MGVITSYSIHYTKLYDGVACRLVEDENGDASGYLLLISGLLKPDTGSITFDGKRIDGQQPHHRITSYNVCYTKLLRTAIRDNNPVIFFEDKMMYQLKGPVPEEEYTIPRITSYNVCYTKLLRLDVEVHRPDHLVAQELQATLEDDLDPRLGETRHLKRTDFRPLAGA